MIGELASQHRFYDVGLIFEELGNRRCEYCGLIIFSRSLQSLTELTCTLSPRHPDGSRLVALAQELMLLLLDVLLASRHNCIYKTSSESSIEILSCENEIEETFGLGPSSRN